MSFLNSLLNEISGDKTSPGSLQKPVAQRRNADGLIKTITSRPNDDISTRIIPQSRLTGLDTPGNAPNLQRKPGNDAEGEVQRGVKRDNTGAVRSGRTPSPSRKMSTPVYRGTAGLAKPRPVIASPKSRLPDRGDTTTRPLNQLIPPKSTTTPASAPKKGSYADMLARAKATAGMPATTIKHKPTERLKPVKSKPGEKKPPDPSSHKRGGSNIRPDPSREGTKKKGIPPKPQPGTETDKDQKRQRTELAYKGTMRGPARPTKVNSSHTHTHSRQRESTNRRFDEDDDLDDDEDEDDRGEYDSDDSDMEADAWELEEEETRASRIARDEDRREQSLEDRLRREKAARKNAMLKKMEADAVARSDRRRNMS